MRRLARHHNGRRRSVKEEHHRLRRQLADEVRVWKAMHREKAAAAARLVASELGPRAPLAAPRQGGQ
jgi:hypothetical protein